MTDRLDRSLLCVAERGLDGVLFIAERLGPLFSHFYDDPTADYANQPRTIDVFFGIPGFPWSFMRLFGGSTGIVDPRALLAKKTGKNRKIAWLAGRFPPLCRLYEAPRRGFFWVQKPAAVFIFSEISHAVSEKKTEAWDAENRAGGPPLLAQAYMNGARQWAPCIVDESVENAVIPRKESKKFPDKLNVFFQK